MKRILSFLSLFIITSLACRLLTAQTPAATGETQPVETTASPPASTEATSAPSATSKPVLLFTIGMHIEPMGETAQGFPGSGKGDYHDPQFFQRQVEDIRTVAQIVEAHGGRMTIQAQSPFTTVAIESGNTILADLAVRGHEIGLHFHEDAHLGKNSSALSVQQWCDVMKEEIGYIVQAAGVTDIRYWSGGNLYPNVYEAAECAGLDVNSDWKNPDVQETDLSLVGVNPWRPAGGTDGSDFTLFTQHNPNGAIVFLPEGQYDKSNFASMQRSAEAGGDEAYFEYLKQSLYASLAAAQPDKVNVFHFTVHPGEFRGDPAQPFAVIENFLTEVVDPLVASGQVQWATFSEMADAYAAWEAAHPGEDPRASAPTPLPPPGEKGAPPGPPPGGSGGGSTPAASSPGKGQQYTVTNPSSNAALAVQVFYPANWDGQSRLPALVLVPGGNGGSSSFVRPASQGPSTVDSLAQAGYVAIVFDPDGRGQSSGTEDYDGFIHQDGLAEVIRFATTLPGVDAANIGLVTFSYGITMGAGTLARYPDLPVKFLIDWEGPANRNDTGGCDASQTGHLQEVASCSDEAFWAQREASTFIGQIRVPYQRIQSEKDHVQPDTTHAILMVNNAVAGGVPWVRLNDLPPNQTYDPANPPAMLPETMDKQRVQLIVEYAAQLFAH